MMTVLREQNVSGLDLDRVLVEVYPASPAYKDSQQFARDLFVEVNKAEPVKWVDMPGVASTADRDVINQAADWLHSQFRPMFSASQNCRVPHVHLDTLRDAVFAAHVLTRHQLTSAKALHAWLLEQNERMRVKYCEPSATAAASHDANGKAATKASATTSTLSAAALAKAQKYNFYLGLDASWYYN